MKKQSEAILEHQFLKQLEALGYSPIVINDEKALLQNLKQHLEILNNIKLSETEFKRVINIINKGSVFERSKTLRQKHYIEQDNGDILYFDFLNAHSWSKNQFQVTNQITIDGK